jgi:hypothetical protein
MNVQLELEISKGNLERTNLCRHRIMRQDCEMDGLRPLEGQGTIPVTSKWEG